jgi:hypothetical protein
MDSIDPADLVAAPETAKELHVQENTLATWRMMGKGPAFVKLGRQVFYHRTDIAKWLAGQRVVPQRHVSTVE